MMRLFFEPNDVWLFRDGRPFDVYAGHRAHTLFPPFPTVIQGAIRSAHLTFRGVSLDDYLNNKAPKDIVEEIGSPGNPPPLSFKLRGPIVAKRHKNGMIERFFTIPADAWLVDDDQYVAFLPNAQTDICSNIPEGLRLLFHPAEESVAKVSNPDLWWRETALLEYLTTGSVKKSALHNADVESVNLGKPISIFKHENRVGIQLESHIRRPREGFIYEIEYARLNNGFGLEAEIEGISDTFWPNSGMVRMGGDGRSARFTRILDQNPLPKVEAKGSNTKLYFAAPTYFNDGWQPKDWSEFFEGKTRLVAAAIEKSISVGGIDLAKADGKNTHEMHKPARRYVPAGSVYFFEGDITLKKGVQAVTHYGENIGFGQFILGRW